MKTDDLINLLASAHDRVDSGRLKRLLWLLAVLSLAAAAGAIGLTVGFRPDLAAAAQSLPVLGKMLLGAGVAGFALASFLASLKPGSVARLSPALVALPLVVAGAFALVALAAASPAEWPRLVLGRNWLACLVLVPAYALLPLAALTLAAREGMPVNPARTGLLAGIAAGGLSTVAYALHCPDDAAPFIAIWYGLAIAVSAGLGRLALPAFATR
jgi:hypothetical protein